MILRVNGLPDGAFEIRMYTELSRNFVTLNFETCHMIKSPSFIQVVQDTQFFYK